MAKIKQYEDWQREILPDRPCTACGKLFVPRYKNKGFECSDRCHRLTEYRRLGHIPRSAKELKYRNAWMKEARRKNPDKYLAIDRDSRKRARDRLGVDGWKTRSRNYNLLHNHGITVQAYERMLAAQNGVCAICCGPPRSKKGFHVDHDHSTGIIRGILCHNCNQGMNALDRFPGWCKKAADYVAKSGGN